MRKKDADSLVEWLDQAEAETKATIAKQERIDPYHDGVLSSIQTFREYIKKMSRIDEVENDRTGERRPGTDGIHQATERKDQKKNKN